MSSIEVFKTVLRLPGRALSWALLGLISLYQRYISPMTGPTCRYYPTCSAYGRRAIVVHGPLKGSVLTVARLLRCNPWSGGGINLVPRKGDWRSPVDTLGNPRHACDREGESPDGSEGPAAAERHRLDGTFGLPRFAPSSNPALDRAA